MKKLIVFLYSIMPIVLIVSAIIDAFCGTNYQIYGSSWFFALWVVFAFWGLLYILQKKMWQQPHRLLFHIALLVILIGAGATWLWNIQNTLIPFVGFGLLVVAMSIIIFSKRGNFRKLVNQSRLWNSNWLLRHKYVIIIGFVLVFQIVFWILWLGIGKQTSALSPVLRSPFLGFHVSVIIVAYALFLLALVNSIVALVLNVCNQSVYAQTVDNLRVINTIVLYPATFLLGIGIGIGAIWANDAWGTYWSWDPKETCALITLLLYSGIFHTESVKKLNQSAFFHKYVIVAFLSVLITCFGVNVMGGMHAY